MTSTDKLSLLALDLTRTYPSSPRVTLAGYVIAQRCLDKCRSVLAGTAGEYHSGCPLDLMWLEYAGIAYEDFKSFVATGATDAEVAAWILEKHTARQKHRSTPRRPAGIHGGLHPTIYPQKPPGVCPLRRLRHRRTTDLSRLPRQFKLKKASLFPAGKPFLRSGDALWESERQFPTAEDGQELKTGSTS
jgi:hypothetical protein